MGSFTNRPSLKWSAWLIAAIIIALNIKLLLAVADLA
jgi:Mn2+/Fe2+ NRAMP family transporter